MSTFENIVALNIGGLSFTGWEEVEIENSIEAIAGKYTLKLAAVDLGHQEVAAIAPGVDATVTIDGETVITGIVDKSGAVGDAKTHQVTVEGRDATAALVDCSYLPLGPSTAAPSNWTDTAPSEIARAIGARLGVKVSIASGADNTALPFFAIQIGETGFAALDRIARMRALLVMPDGNGGAVLGVAGTGPVYSSLRTGETGNIEHYEGSFDHKARFGHYVVLGQAAGNDVIPPEQAAGLRADAYDPAISPTRVKIIHSELMDAASLQGNAQWEAARAAARARKATIRTLGWRDEGGQLWAPNGTVHVDCPFLALNETMLVASRKLTKNTRDGEVVDLVLTRPQAYMPEPLGPLAEFDQGGGAGRGR